MIYYCHLCVSHWSRPPYRTKPLDLYDDESNLLSASKMTEYDCFTVETARLSDRIRLSSSS